MARINVDDSWWVSLRRKALIRLLGEEERADGAALALWRAAQEEWKENRGLLSKRTFDLLPYAAALLECDLAVIVPKQTRSKPEANPKQTRTDSELEYEGASVYVRGASKQFEWIENRRKAAATGGRKSVEKRRSTNGTAQPFPKQTRSKPEANPKQTRTDSEPTPNRLEPSSSSSPSSSPSSSSSSSALKKTIGGIRIDYPPEFESVWVQYGKKGEKKAAFMEWGKLRLDDREKAELSLAIGNYQQRQPDKQFRKDLERFLPSDWRELLTWKPEPSSGGGYANGKVKQHMDLVEHNRRVKEEWLAKQKELGGDGNC